MSSPKSIVIPILNPNKGIGRLLALSFLVLATLTLSSCIEGEEEVWIENDGSGRARFEITAPTLLFQKFGGVETIISDAKEGLATSQNISLEMIESSTSGSKTSLQAEVSFDDARKLGSTLRQFRDPSGSSVKSDEEILFGDAKVGIKFPEIHYQRLLDFRSLIPPEASNPMALRLLGDSEITYKVHLPTKVKTHNASAISADGRTLTWNIPVSNLVSETNEMTFTAPIPKLALYCTLAGILLFSSCLAVLLLWKRKRQSPQT